MILVLDILVLVSIIIAAIILYSLASIIFSNGIININHQQSYTISPSYLCSLRFYSPFFVNSIMNQLSLIPGFMIYGHTSVK